MTGSFQWYSARIRLVCLIEGEGATIYQDSVVVMRAADFREAFQRALEVGRGREEEYLNADGELVRWRLKAVFSLDVIQADQLDGAEVYSEPVELEPGDRDPFDITYAPESSEPTQTI
jgi:Domain of unknown function (DUF4288)